MEDLNDLEGGSEDDLDNLLDDLGMGKIGPSANQNIDNSRRGTRVPQSGNSQIVDQQIDSLGFS